MSMRPSRRSAVRLFPYPARRLAPLGAAFALDGSLALAPDHALGHIPSTGPPRRPSPVRLVAAGTRSAPRPVRTEAGPLDTDLATSVEVIMRLAFEALAGRRPLHHLARWVTLKVSEELSGHRPAVPAVERVSAPRILTSWIQTPAPHHAEAGAVAQVGARVQAIALGLERFRGRWRCRALETTIPHP